MTRRIAVKKNILAPAVALSLGLTGSLGAIAAPAFADEPAKNTPTSNSQQAGNPSEDGTPPPAAGEDNEEQPGEGDDDTPDNGSATISADKITLSEFREKGIEVSYKGGKPGNPVDFSLHRKGSDTEIYSEQIDADENGAAKATIKPKIDDENAEEFLGEYEIVVNLDFGMSGVNIDTLPFTVVPDENDSEEDEAPAKDPALNLSEKKVKAVDFVNEEKGLKAVVSNLEPGTEVKFNVAGTSGNAKNVRPFKQTVKADKDGNAVFSIKGISEDDASAYLGKYTVTAEFDDQKLEGSFEVVSGKGSGSEEEEAPAKDPALNLSEKKVKAVDFVNEEKGLKAVVSNLEPGTEVKFNVAGTSGNAKNVRPFKQTVKADKDGNAVFSIKGISEDNPSAYLGKYTVTAEFDDQKLEDSFEVVSGKGGKSDSEESGSGGGSVSGGASDNVAGSSDSGTLPRTGQGLGGLAAGVALLTVGGATVLLTRRTRKA